ncbi:hypothetical protein VCHC51A1_2532 [Vibrio cholerae HC-51A1]|nr:hypothetical protein VCHE48_3643 [Vibrio cholerae HE48]EGS67835.1 hypothetical protein VCBJG01_2480 [Vibrio cholerae BJG-01]EJH64880.1 hypothetical protein VCHE45_2513 [Vibrio cholerae HE-45]EKG48924.1 hypothetical protein VCHC50A1_2638 [Vibrio cholerae HC-50A1]EKG54730.1 hypothetical protein VCHC52A1_2639 [Vibrio cholerae HC-52A1]EKG59675.1 hypothetical protein VCHC55A1_2636 [Vibrio cholerae HC-55A1]EKG66488.1 hypothetical protein VCCP103710_2946 [Vibrio cholerae CP1037(10)]EKG67903.1 hy
MKKASYHWVIPKQARFPPQRQPARQVKYSPFRSSLMINDITQYLSF